jgi:hypothetical protein
LALKKRRSLIGQDVGYGLKKVCKIVEIRYRGKLKRRIRRRGWLD